MGPLLSDAALSTPELVPTLDLARLDPPLHSRSELQIAYEYQRDTAVRRIGAELYIAQHREFSSASPGFSVHEAQTYLNHFSFLKYEFGKENNPSISHCCAELFNLTRAWVSIISETVPDSDDRARVSREYFASAGQLYRELQSATVLAHLPGAERLGLSLVEFDTDFSGYCPEILEQVELLERELLVDTTLGRPQEGFGGVLSVDQLLEVLRFRQSRLLVVFAEETVCGFYLPIMNSESVRCYAGAHCESLVEQGILKADETVGWAHITGTARTNRVMMARAGVNLYQLLDQTVMVTAAREGIRTLLGAVREGENANTSVKAHFRMGWEATDHTFSGADGSTPYRTILRTVPPVVPAAAAHQDFGAGSHFEKYAGSAAVTDSGLDTWERLITIDQTLTRCRDFFAEERDIGVKKCDGAHGEYVSITLTRGMFNATYYLERTRPGVDHWKYIQGSSGSNIGSLDELLLRISDDMDEVYGYRRFR